MIEGHDTINGTADLLIQRIYDVLPMDAECQRLFLLWKKQLKDLARSGRPASHEDVKAICVTFKELLMNMQLEGVEKF